jgi:hypothetical protein
MFGAPGLVMRAFGELRPVELPQELPPSGQTRAPAHQPLSRDVCRSDGRSYRSTLFRLGVLPKNSLVPR